jgi:hypothetical protein
MKIRGTVCFVPSVEYFYKTKIEYFMHRFPCKKYRGVISIATEKLQKPLSSMNVRTGSTYT